MVAVSSTGNVRLVSKLELVAVCLENSWNSTRAVFKQEEHEQNRAKGKLPAAASEKNNQQLRANHNVL
jgi:hypothetical protein